MLVQQVKVFRKIVFYPNPKLKLYSRKMLVHTYFEEINSISMAALLMFYVQSTAKDEYKNMTILLISISLRSRFYLVITPQFPAIMR
jgi:hypothetical protein